MPVSCVVLEELLSWEPAGFPLEQRGYQPAKDSGFLEICCPVGRPITVLTPAFSHHISGKLASTSLGLFPASYYASIVGGLVVHGSGVIVPGETGFFNLHAM